MIADDLPTINPNVDYTKILPIQQKRMIAFVNHFIMNWVSYLNSFTQSCESRFMQFEYKMQKVEASLLILESQLSSVNGLQPSSNNTKPLKSNIDVKSNHLPTPDLSEVPPNFEPDVSNVTEEPCAENNGIKAKDDPRYSRFFTMLRVGVPPQAVKLKMASEGIESNILDNPDSIIPEI